MILFIPTNRIYFRFAQIQKRGVKPPRVGKARQQYLLFWRHTENRQNNGLSAATCRPSPLFEWAFLVLLSIQKYRKSNIKKSASKNLLTSILFIFNPLNLIPLCCQESSLSLALHMRSFSFYLCRALLPIPLHRRESDTVHKDGAPCLQRLCSHIYRYRK